ncbi:MAG: outer membrane protein assembly factor BamE [Acidiferrobacterales bacterium]|jgi:outer membrane protein assembly factor BamE|nr:outer membrane protein assembly factor BamE [Acidiferrobacterales bacterium]
MRHLLLSLALLTAVSVSGCNILYVQDIEQGNILTPDMIDQIRPGMTRKQVTFILGTPLVEDPFHADRWDYYYSLKPGDKQAVGKKQVITIYFKGDRVTQIIRDMPDSKPGSGEKSSG